MNDLVIKNGQLVTPDRIYKADIAIKDGKYAAIVAPGTELEAKEVIDAKGNYVYPGIIDCHAHLNEPGFEYREDFETGSRAAAVAGCTTLIDMPLNNDPSLMNKEIFDLKMGKISKHSVVDYALWGGIVGDYNNEPGSVKNNMNDLVDLHNCGVAAFKGFTCPNGDLFPTVNMGNVRKALEILKPYNALCGFHCEEYGQVLEREREAKAKEGRTNEEKIRDFLDAHDVWTELVATKNVLDSARLLFPEGILKALDCTGANWGFILAIAASVAMWIIIEKTTLGYKLKAVGFNKDAATFGGINANRSILTALGISGALAGVGGAVQILGMAGRISQFAGQEGYGFQGITVALIAGSNPLGCILAGIFYGAMKYGGAKLTMVGAPEEVIDIIMGCVIIFIAISGVFKALFKKFGKKK